MEALAAFEEQVALTLPWAAERQSLQARQAVLSNAITAAELQALAEAGLLPARNRGASTAAGTTPTGSGTSIEVPADGSAGGQRGGPSQRMPVWVDYRAPWMPPRGGKPTPGEGSLPVNACQPVS